MPILTARTTPTPEFLRRQPPPHRATPVAAVVSAHAPRLASGCRPRRPATLFPATFPLSPPLADRCVVALSLLVLLATGVDAGWR